MRTIATFHGDELFFRHDLSVYVNRADENFAVPLHDHDFVEIAFVTEGSGFHHIGERVCRVAKGELFVIPIGVPHVFRPSAADAAKHPLAVYNCVISPRLLHQIHPNIKDETFGDFIRSLDRDDCPGYSLQDPGDELDKLFQALHREYTLRRQGSVDYLNALVIQLLITVHRLILAEPSVEGTQEPHPAPFIRVLQYLDQHIEEELTMSRLAQVSGYSERHLRRLFHMHTGQSLQRYRQNLRIEKSCVLLRNTDLKIGTVAEQVGYRDIDTFTALFKRCVGKTPGEFRKRNGFD
ncbi:AraC family transcriptional regulator [Cohnella sp. CFH 77786]|uniref:AraC family transcriptional regulator n=1 Tax=Cohnella sp. CFH 77786 TaxID=2662265 RepID=UPI001C610E05|nr:AraC family transcriptional regulator [Cohnella sp. CFH 77786]